MTTPAYSRLLSPDGGHGPSGRLWWLIGLASLLLGASFLFSDSILRLVCATTGGVFVSAAGLGGALSLRRGQRQAFARQQLIHLVMHDAAPTFFTDADGQIEFQNVAAQERFGAESGQSLIRAMRHLFANPAAVMFRLQSKAGASGAAREDIVTQRGHARLSVHEMSFGHYLWRLEEMLDRSGSRGAEALSVPMLIASRTGTVLFMNESLRRLLGQRPKTLDRIFPQLPLHSGEECLISTQDGPRRVFLAEVAGVGDRRELYLFPDWPKPRSAPAAELASFEQVPVALALLDDAGALLRCNRLARDLLGLEPAQAEEGHHMRAPASEAVHLSDLLTGLGRPVGDWVADVRAGRNPGRPEVLRAARSEADRFLQVSLRRTVDEGRSGVLAVLSDATELKTLEAQIVQSQKMQAIGQLAGGVAHDFNNLLTAIAGHCDLLLLRHEKGDPDYGDLAQIHQNANRAASLVRQLLAFSRKQTLQPELIDLNEILGDLTHLLNRLVGETIQLQRAHVTELWSFRADRRQLDQVLMNLVVNARDAMPEGGTIWIETENLHLDADLSRDRAVVPAGDYVVLRVRDEGIGIPAERLDKIFEPFFTTKRNGEGTGLGLSTVYGIMKQTGGFIFVDSLPGTGTTFSLYLPAQAGGTVAQETASPVWSPLSAEGAEEAAIVSPLLLADAIVTLPDIPAGEGVILLVEDEAPVRAFAAQALRLRGHTVVEAESGEAALGLLEDPALLVDVVVSDVIMPGLDGPSWVAEALSLRPHMRIVFVSGYAEDSFAEAQARIPNSVFLPKPFSLSELTQVVQQQIRLLDAA